MSPSRFLVDPSKRRPRPSKRPRFGTVPLRIEGLERRELPGSTLGLLDLPGDALTQPLQPALPPAQPLGVLSTSSVLQQSVSQPTSSASAQTGTSTSHPGTSATATQAPANFQAAPSLGSSTTPNFLMGTLAQSLSLSSQSPQHSTATPRTSASGDAGSGQTPPTGGPVSPPPVSPPPVSPPPVSPPPVSPPPVSPPPVSPPPVSPGGTGFYTPGIRGGYIFTPWDKIPDFGAHPTITSAHSGAWSNPNTWSLGRLPTTGDVVDITPGTTVTYDVASAARIQTVEVQAGGELDFATTVNTRLMVANFVVLQGGTLTIGTAANPVAANVTADVSFLDQPLNTTLDPAQYGNGLIGLGTVTVYGAAMPETFIRLASEPRAGDTTLTLSQPAAGWHVGDRLLLPDTRQLNNNERGSNYVSQLEDLTLAAISPNGLTLTLSKPLAYSHLGWHDVNGVVQDLPHVADLSHNVIIHSENPSGVRGHVLFTYRATVNVQNAAFVDTGRTTNAAFDDTTFAPSGNVSHLGTNESGRYAVQFLHLMGPAAPAAGSPQYLFAGNAVY